MAVLSGNRNFPGRVHPDLDYGFLMSPPSVIAFALAGRADIDISSEPLGTDHDGNPVYLHEIWPSPHDIDETFTTAMAPDDFGTDFYEASNNKLWHEIDALMARCFRGMRSPRFCARRLSRTWTNSRYWAPMTRIRC